ncbi:MAG: hypothetical protein RIM99_10875 [Cyclobacteriaceae bacterium]
MRLLICLCICSFIFPLAAQEKYQAGYYIDYSDSVHHGLIQYFMPKTVLGLPSDKMEGYNRVRFRVSLSEKSVLLGPADVKKFVVNEETYIVREIDVFTNGSIPLNNKSIDFVKVLETGKIRLYKHTYPYFQRDNEGTKSLRRSIAVQYHVIKDTSVILVNGDLYSRFKLLRDFVEDAPVILRKLEEKDYGSKELRKLITDYNIRATGKPEMATITLFRGTGKRLPKEVEIFYRDRSVGTLSENTLLEFEVQDVFDFSLCMSEGNCASFSGSAGEVIYMELKQNKKESLPAISIVNEEVGQFNHKRISYLMEKEKKKGN